MWNSTSLTPMLWVAKPVPSSTWESVVVDGKRWQVGIAPSPLHGKFEQVSSVNNIATTSGGRHVEYVERKVVDAVLESLGSKGRQLKSALKDTLWLFFSCQVVNPAFAP